MMHTHFACHFSEQLATKLIQLIFSKSYNINLLFYNRDLRSKDASKFHVQLCSAIFLMLLVFMVGIDKTEHSIGCTVVSVLIQYFTLASVFWMGGEAVLMFKKLVIVFSPVTTKFHIIISLICWGRCGQHRILNNISFNDQHAILCTCRCSSDTSSYRTYHSCNRE